jgi:glutaredoxin 3
LLESREIAYEAIDVSTDNDRRRWLVEASGQRTVPQIFIDDKSIGGYQELSALDRSGDLADMLKD